MSKVCKNYSLLLKSLNAIKQSSYTLKYYSNSPSAKNIESDSKYCLNLVRSHDYENFLCILLIKQQQERQCTFAIRAFNVEVSKIASVVSDDKIGIMRLKFWYNALDSIYDLQKSGKPIPDHPVIRQLNLAIKKYQLPKIYFTRLIRARENSIKMNFITKKEFEKYADETVSSIFHLQLKICNCVNIDADHAASHLGKACGTINILRSIASIKRRSQSIGIPHELLIKYGVSEERILRDKGDDIGVQDCIFDLASLAHVHLEKTRNLSTKIPLNIRYIFLPAISTGRYLERLRKFNFHINNPKLLRRDSMLPFIFYWNYFTKSF